MGLRCSLFGHAFEDPVTERDRETRGAEVLISVREVRRCSRCGDEQVIAENTEVRRLGPEERHSATDAGDTGMADRLESAEGSGSSTRATDEVETEPDDRERETSTPTAESDTADTGVADTGDISQYVDSAEEPEETAAEEPERTVAEDEDVEILDDEADSQPPDAGEAVETEPAEEAPERDESADDGGELLDESESDGAEVEGGEVLDETAAERSPEPDAEPTEDEVTEDEVTDDAIIIDNDAGQEDRESDIGRRELAGTGNMFDAGNPEADVEETSPDSELTDFHESAGTEPDADRAEMVEDATETGDSDHEPWPGADDSAVSDDPGFQFGPEMQTDESAVDAGGNSGGEGSGFTTEGPVDVEGETADSPPKAVVCPECGYETRAIGSSLRAGDICPECHSGYLAERR